MHRIPLALLLLGALAAPLLAQDKKPAEKKDIKPIRALLITGGCCHDYTKQKLILPEAVSKRANVEWVTVQQGGTGTKAFIPYYEKEDWAKGFDIVVHNECFSDAADPAWTAKILKPHREGTPAVVIHCAMHCYRDKTDEWFKFLGVTSRGHGANYAFEVENLEKDDPIMKDFGDKWMTPKGELYIIEKLWPSAKPLAHAMSKDTKKNEVCIWTNMYTDKTRVFGTTIGHHNEEMNDPVFQNYVTRGLLWACDKLNDDYLVPAKEIKIEHIGEPERPKGPMGEPTPADPKNKTGMKVRVQENLALGKKTSASTWQDENGHKSDNAVDDDLSTRWCAKNDKTGNWWQVDLEKPQEIRGCRVTWEFDQRAYAYTIDGSADGKEWKTLVDAKENKPKPQTCEHKFDAKDIRFVKITISGLSPQAWASFFEFEVLGPNMVEKVVSSSPASPNAKKLLSGIKVPAGFNVSLFAAPPDAGYPTCLGATPSGEVYIGIDENGSLDAKPGRGRVVRAIDKDGDGVADEFKTFAKMDSPRGVVVDGKTVYVMHPPKLTAFHDDNGDGESDRSEVIVDGLGFDLKFRGADHTTNGMQLGIDGYLYIAVGDYGFIKAKAKDGTELSYLGGGVVRVRPDGTGLEVVSRGQRNIYDVAIDPFMNLFTRDNTNDGGGWNVRLSHVIPGGNYGYPSQYINFPDEIVQPLADYGGGSPCGSLFVDEGALPAPFGHALYTCDWGRSIVYRHPLTAKGAGFEAKQETFVEIPRPTDMEVDAAGNFYIASWRDGGFNYSGPNVGYVVKVSPQDAKPTAVPDVANLGEVKLPPLMESPSHVVRLAVMRELARRNYKITPYLKRIGDRSESLSSKIAAVHALAHMQTDEADGILVKWIETEDVLREHSLRALANRAERVERRSGLFVGALADTNPRVRMAAAYGVRKTTATTDEIKRLVPLVADADPLVGHTAIQSLSELKAGQACLAAIVSGPQEQVAGAKRVVQAIHDLHLVETIAAAVDNQADNARQRALLGALCRLYLDEAPYTGQWWGTRPDTSGPYYKGVEWKGSPQVAAALKKALAESPPEKTKWLLGEVKRNKVNLGDQTKLVMELAANDAGFRATALELVSAEKSLSKDAREFITRTATSDDDRNTQQQALNVLYKHASEEAGFAAAVDATTAVLSSMKSASPTVNEKFTEFAREPTHAARIDYLVQLTADESTVRQRLAWQVLLGIEANAKAAAAARRKALAAIEAAWKSPAQSASLLYAIAAANADTYALQVTKLRDSQDEAVRAAANYAFKRLDLDSLPNESDPNRVTVVSQKPEDVLAAVQKDLGDPKLGAKLFIRQGCTACHSTKQGETLKGPYLGGIAARYKRHELAESVLTPAKKIAQGFETQWFQTADGLTLEGFVVRESGDEVEIRNQQGAASVIAKKDIEERGKRETSIMPNGLVDKLTAQEFAGLLAYLESLKQ